MVSEKTSVIDRLIDQAERGRVPDLVVRTGIRKLLRDRIALVESAAGGEPGDYVGRFVETLDRLPVADCTAEANAQHYELPTAFFERVLGPRMKYSSCLYAERGTTLAEAEEEMLRLTCARAELAAGQRILELGCGWGSLSLWMAEHYPDAQITCVTNSAVQAQYLRAKAAAKGFGGVEVIHCDINRLDLPAASFDRVVSVEMFEHVRNYRALFGRVAAWLKDDGKLFIHIFAHRALPYLFETGEQADWMARYFFSGGTMPSHELFLRCQDDFRAEETWRVNGRHYARTLEDWLVRTDKQRKDLLPLLEEHYGKADAARWLQRWRMFFMACAELFAFRV